ncbi:MAG TPA: hypothetical protein OIM42_01870 [Clostridiaceae bacterium]|nr:hypothetical protein [Clostridiaceae bacterium]
MEKDRVSILNALKRILLNEKDDKDGDKNLEEIIDDQNTPQNDKELAEYLLKAREKAETKAVNRFKDELHKKATNKKDNYKEELSKNKVKKPKENQMTIGE